MSVIRWEAPPPTNRGRAVGTGPDHVDPFAELAATLRSRPGEWAVVFEGQNASASHVATRFRSGMVPSTQPPGSFEASSRKLPNGMTATYARYVGDPS